MPGPLRTLTLMVSVPLMSRGAAVGVGWRGVTERVGVSVGSVDGEGAADGVGGVSGANRVEAEGAEDVPGGGLAGILVAA